MTTETHYGNVRIAKIRAAYNDLRTAVQSGNIEAAQTALDRYEQWADYAFADPEEVRTKASKFDALRQCIKGQTRHKCGLLNTLRVML